jgi:hypothetical protein
MVSDTIWIPRHVTGAALILGSILLLIGAYLYGRVRDPNGRMIFGQPPQEWVRLVVAHPRLWSWATGLFIAGVLMTLLGQSLLAELLRQGGDPGFAHVALIALVIGAVLWIINLAFRLTVDPRVGATLARTSVMPDFYVPLRRWTNALFVVYTILTFAGLVAYGAAILGASLLPHWLGWIAIAYGLAGLVVLAVTHDAPPFVHYLMPIVIGVFLLLQ